MQVKIKKNSPNAVIPKYANDGDAGLDFTATSILKEDEFQITYNTDIALEIPKGYVGLVYPRSSIRNYNILLSNSVGVIDSIYRGNIQATFIKTKGWESKVYKVGERIFQMIIAPYPSIEFIETYELSETERGTNGFGSTNL